MKKEFSIKERKKIVINLTNYKLREFGSWLQEVLNPVFLVLFLFFFRAWLAP